MKKLILGFLLAFAFSSAYATLATTIPSATALGNENYESAANSMGRVYPMGYLSGTSTAQTGVTMKLHNTGGFRVRVDNAAYLGTVKIQVSDDKVNWYTVRQDNCLTTGQTYTWHYLNKESWRWFRAYGDPDGSNAGACTVTLITLPRENRATGDTGLCGPQAAVQTVANSTAATQFGYIGFKVKYNTGFRVHIYAAVAAVTLTPVLYHLDTVNGAYTALGTATTICSTSSGTGNIMFDVSPYLLTSGTTVIHGGGQDFAINLAEGAGVTHTYSITIEPY